MGPRRRRPIIRAEKLSKRYQALEAVSELDLSVQEGEIFGLLGPNGAGKTTTILMLLGLTEPSSGRAEVCGFDSARQPLEVKRRVGYLPENVGFYEDLTGWENLLYTCDLNGLRGQEAEGRIAEALERVGLSEAAHRPAGAYSRGMRQRLGIADVLVKRPQVAILDEPTIGLDPEGSEQTLEIIRQLRQGGMTIMLSSHLLHQVQAICDRVGIFVRGRLVALGRVEELGAQISTGQPLTIEVWAEPDEGLAGLLRSLPGVLGVERDGHLLSVHSREDLRGEIARRLVQEGRRLEHLRLRGWSLDDIYLRYFREEEAAYARAIGRTA